MESFLVDLRRWLPQRLTQVAFIDRPGVEQNEGAPGDVMSCVAVGAYSALPADTFDRSLQQIEILIGQLLIQ